MSARKLSFYCMHCGLDMLKKEQRLCRDCDGDLCEPKRRIAAEIRKARRGA